MSRFRRMVLFAMFDMPTETKGDLKRYRQFRKDLISYGFIMFQYSVYVRFCDSLYMAEKYESKIEEVAPEKSSIRVLRVTENQYKNMLMIENYREKPEEKVQEMTQLVMVF